MADVSFFGAVGGTGIEALKRLHVEQVLLPILIQLIVIIVAARVFALLFRRIGQPMVVGEIAAGLVLGPSLLGWVLPGVAKAIFHPAIEGVPQAEFDVILHWVFTVLSQIGLILLLFLIGLEFDFEHLRWNGKSALAISVTGVALPFSLGLILAQVILPYLEPHPESGLPVPPTGFALFLGTALSITAIPVLGRMMMEWNLTRTRLGTITISAAAVDDATGWITLAAVAAAVRSELEWKGMVLMVAGTVAFGLAMAFVARPLLRRLVRRMTREGSEEIGLNGLAMLIVILLGCAVATNLIGVFAILGAFFLGAVLSGEHGFREAVSRRLRDFVTVFFLPIFFTYTGLRTEVRSLDTPVLWVLCGLVLAAAVLGKFAGCGLAARMTGFNGREASCIGIMMNTRGLMELIVINVGYELRVIPGSVFCMLVLMALATTAMTSPLLLRFIRGTDLEELVRSSGFLKDRRSSGVMQEESALPSR